MYIKNYYILEFMEKISNVKWKIYEKGMKVPAYVFASEALLEAMKKDRTLEQLKNLAYLPGVYKQVLCMPDGHQGYGFPIGGVAALDIHEGGVSPGGVGYDINCGVRLLRSNLSKKEVVPKIKELINQIYKNVPCGVGVGGIMGKLSDSELNKVLNEGSEWALKNGYAIDDDLYKTEEGGRLPGNANFVSQKAKNRGRDQLGSLGAGNHFLEVQFVEEVYDEKTANELGLTKDTITIMIHCGSRGLGHQVCSDYLREIEKTHPELINSLPDRELVFAPSHSKLCEKYLKAMNSAANFAWANRQLIAHQVRKSFKKIFGATDLTQIYDVCHNICKLEEFDGKKVYIHRKGATRCAPKGHPLVPKVYSNIGQPALIPGTMGTASYVVIGMQSCIKESFMSTAHGSGRLMSRHKAKKSFTESEIKKQLSKRNIIIKSRTKFGVIEEAPGAYKNIDEVVKTTELAGIAKRIVRLRPLGVIKG